MLISIVAALARNRVIGTENRLPWHLPEDMRNFASLTQYKTVLMGRKTYESLPAKYRPLPNRTNLVVTTQAAKIHASCIVVRSPEEGVTWAKNQLGVNELFVIGGASIYESLLPIANRLYLTEVQSIVEGDAFFPPIDHRQWREIGRVVHPVQADRPMAFDFVEYERIEP